MRIFGFGTRRGDLTIAHTICSGAHLRLSHKIAERQFASQPITQGWLEEVMTYAAEIGGREELERMLLALGETMDRNRIVIAQP